MKQRLDGFMRRFCFALKRFPPDIKGRGVINLPHLVVHMAGGSHVRSAACVSHTRPETITQAVCEGREREGWGIRLVYLFYLLGLSWEIIAGCAARIFTLVYEVFPKRHRIDGTQQQSHHLWLSSEDRMRRFLNCLNVLPSAHPSPQTGINAANKFRFYPPVKCLPLSKSFTYFCYFHTSEW